MGELGPCLDPLNEDAWFATMAGWISDPAAVQAYEVKVAAFRAPTWRQAAERYFAAAFDEQWAIVALNEVDPWVAKPS